MHRQANIPHESPVDRMGKKYEGGPRPKWGDNWQPLRCLSPPWARKGGEGETPDGRWRGWRKGTTSGPRVDVEVCLQGRSPGICVHHQSILDCICQLKVFVMNVTLCAKIVCVLRGAGQA